MRTIHALAKATGLEFDGDLTDRRLHELRHVETLRLTEDQYERWEERVESFEVAGSGFLVYISHDVSGYDYWTRRQGEDNYMNITVRVDAVSKIDPRELERALSKARNLVSEYERR